MIVWLIVGQKRLPAWYGQSLKRVKQIHVHRECLHVFEVLVSLEPGVVSLMENEEDGGREQPAEEPG